MMDLVSAEWLKLRTTRLLVGLIAASAALSLAAVAGKVLTVDDIATLESSDGIAAALSVAGAGVLLVLVLGILISAGEYRHGTAADTFLTTPQRHRVLTAKLAVGAGVGLIAGVVIALACVAMASLLYSAQGAAFPIGHAEVWLTVAGISAYATLFAVLGVALGSMIRNQVLAVAGALTWFAVVEHAFISLLPDVGRWFPAAAGQAIVRTPLDGLLPPAGGIAVLVAYGVAITVAGIRVAATRDA